MDYSKIHPLNGIIVLKIKGTQQSEGGIVFIEEKRLDEAEVVAVGPGEWILKDERKKPEFRKVGVRVGDSVMLGPGSGVILDITIGSDTESLAFIAETDVVAIIRKENVEKG